MHELDDSWTDGPGHVYDGYSERENAYLDAADQFRKAWEDEQYRRNLVLRELHGWAEQGIFIVQLEEFYMTGSF
jgi:hypothetical protein